MDLTANLLQLVIVVDRFIGHLDEALSVILFGRRRADFLNAFSGISDHCVLTDAAQRITLSVLMESELFLLIQSADLNWIDRLDIGSSDLLFSRSGIQVRGSGRAGF